MKVAVLFEFSGIVRDAFIACGHDAISFDLLPTERPGPHRQGDLLNLDFSKFDLAICHPPCTYLCNSGIRWLYLDGNKTNGIDQERVTNMLAAVDVFNWCLNLPVEKICIENPRPHIYADIPNSTQIIHPWQHGHTEQKETHLWLKNLPKIKPTQIMRERNQTIHRLPPRPLRQQERARTFEGIAAAFANQWG